MKSGIDQTLNTIPAASVTQFNAKLTSEALIAHILSFVTADTTVLTVVIICTFDAAVTLITDILTFLTESTPFTGICWTADTAIWAVCSIVHGTFRAHVTLLTEFVPAFVTGAALRAVIFVIATSSAFLTAVVATITDVAVTAEAAAEFAVDLRFPCISCHGMRGKRSDDHSQHDQDTPDPFLY